jgi:O-antigen/teichoic acid export membrane protein
MRWGSKVHKNSLFSFLSSVVRLGTNILMFVGVARFYGAETFGQFTVAHAYFTLALTLGDFGLDMLLATEIARDLGQAERTIARILPLKIAFGLLATLAFGFVAWMLGLSDATTRLMLIMSLGILATTLTTFCFAIGKGFEALDIETRATFLQQTVLLVVLVGLGVMKVSVYWIAWAFVLTRVVGLVSGALQVFRRYHIRITFRLMGMRDTPVGQWLPFGVTLIFGTLLIQQDTLLLAAWKGDHAAGLYQAAMKLIAVVLVVPDVVTAALLPVFSRLFVENRGRWQDVVGITAKFLCFVCVPVVVVFLIYPSDVISLVYGDHDFQEAIPVLAVLGLMVFVRFSVETFGLVLTTTRRQIMRMWIVVVSAILNVLLNSYAIPRYGIVGAAWVSLVCNIVVGVLYVLSARRVGMALFEVWTPRVVKSLGIVAGICVLLSFRQIIPFIPGMVIAGVGIPILLFYYGFSQQERQYVLMVKPLRRELL